MTQLDQLIADITNASRFVTDSNNEEQIARYVEIVDESLSHICFLKWGNSK